MNRVSDLNMIKGRDLAHQRAVIDDLTTRFVRTTNGVDAVLAELPKDELVDLSVEEPEQTIRYALLAMIAADIATVPYQEGRAFHMEGLKELASIYDLSPRKIIYLTNYADEWMNRLEALERKLGIM
jgi:hypothetical protein